MRLSGSDIKQYPKFAAYVKHQMPKLTHVPVVVKNLQKHGSFTAPEARHALAWGTDPLIVITDLHNGQCGVPQAYGCTKPQNVHEIELHIGDVQAFESGSGIDKSRPGKYVYVTGATILHELCHWGNFKKGVAEPTEAGERFERATYKDAAGAGRLIQ